jgi:uncharacterized membrane protein
MIEAFFRVESLIIGIFCLFSFYSKKKLYLCSMKINPIYKVRKVAGENIILLQGKNSGDMTRVVAFNASALLMWDSLQGKDFTVDDAVKVLLDNYEVEESVARADAEKWVATIKENGLLLAE